MEIVVPYFSVLCAILLLILLQHVLSKRLELGILASSLGLLSLAAFPPFAVWSSSGMAAMPAALCLFLVFDLLFFSEDSKAGYWAGLAGLALVMLRAEGIAWVLFMAVLALFNEESRNRLLSYLAISVGGFTLYFLWRYSYYGMLVPNTVANKVAFSLPVLHRGLNYAVVFFLTFLTPIVIPFGLALYLRQEKHRQVFIPLMLLSAALLFYPVLVGGDFMAMGRFYVPLFPFISLLLAIAIEHLDFTAFTRAVLGLLVVGAGMLPALNIHLVDRSIRKQFHFRKNTSVFRSEKTQWLYMRSNSVKWRLLGEAMNDISTPQDSIVASAIGNLGYYSHMKIYDRCGLVEPVVIERSLRKPRRKSPGHDKSVPRSFFLKYEPTFLNVYLLKLPKQRRKVEATITKWNNRPELESYKPLLIELEEWDDKGNRFALLALKKINTH